MFEALHQVGDELVACVHKLLPASQQAAELELTEILFRFNTDVIGTCAFGIRCNTLHTDQSEFREIGRKMLQFTRFKLFKLYVAMLFRREARALRFRLVDGAVSTFILRVVREAIEVRRTQQQQSPGVRHQNDFLQIMIDLLDETETKARETSGAVNGARLTVEEIAANVFVFFFAGFETSSTVMAYALYELAQNPDIQDRARVEIATVQQKHGGQMTFECVAEMTFLEQIINGKRYLVYLIRNEQVANNPFRQRQKPCASIRPLARCIVFPSPTMCCPMAPQCHAAPMLLYRRWLFIGIPNSFRDRNSSIRTAFRRRIVRILNHTRFCHSARDRAFVLG